MVKPFVCVLTCAHVEPICYLRDRVILNTFLFHFKCIYMTRVSITFGDKITNEQY